MNLSLRFSLDSELLFFFILDYISKLGNNECAVVLYYIPLIWKKLFFFHLYGPMISFLYYMDMHV